jgi:hypothetical protein
MGGLGNQLFQIFATISCAITYQHKFVFLDKENLGNNRFTYWNTFLKRLSRFTTKSLPPMNIKREIGFEFSAIEPINQDENIYLFGYYQSEKYFKPHYETIKKLIGIELLQKNITQNCIFECECNFKNTISIHFRLGDYKNLPDHHPILGYDYYQNAISHIFEKTERNNWSILFFCEKEDNLVVQQTIQQLSQVFGNATFVKATDDVADWEQMLMMSCCQHNVIANSSFSWWGAYFNSFPDKIVCYPSTWFGVKLAHHNLCDLFPETWTRI